MTSFGWNEARPFLRAFIKAFNSNRAANVNMVSCTLSVMRRALAIETCLAVVLAFLFAPFQHVHTGNDHADGDHHHHAEAGVMHAHFFVAPVHHAQAQGIGIDADDDDDHAHALSIDTFTPKQPSFTSLSLPSRSLLVAFAPDRTIDPVEIIEERGHDPP
ncbi:MAG: hypothetical protein M3N54_01015, partial [Acidobacteriota bacterium]|nr:hypothetical protein [Acidobacteriota bacterium]